MNRMDWRIGLIALLLFVGAWAAGCSGDLGDFCQTDEDCTADLRCSARPGPRGVCIYPEGVVDPDGAQDSGEDAEVDATIDAPGTDAPLDSALDGPQDALDGATDTQSIDGMAEAVAEDSAGDQG